MTLPFSFQVCSSPPKGSVPHATWLLSVSAAAQAVPHMSTSSSTTPALSACAYIIAVSLLTGQEQAGNSSVLLGFSTASCLPDALHDKQLPWAGTIPSTGHWVTSLWGQHLPALPTKVLWFPLKGLGPPYITSVQAAVNQTSRGTRRYSLIIPGPGFPWGLWFWRWDPEVRNLSSPEHRGPGGGCLGGDLICLPPPSKESSEGMGSAWWWEGAGSWREGRLRGGSAPGRRRNNLRFPVRPPRAGRGCQLVRSALLCSQKPMGSPRTPVKSSEMLKTSVLCESNPKSKFPLCSPNRIRDRI